MQIRRVSTNIKPGAKRPEAILLGRKITILKGDHGAGKTRWDQALEFAFRGSVRDLAYRHDQPMREAGVLLRLTLPTEPRLYATVEWDGGAFTRTMPITVDNKGIPHGGRVSAEPVPGVDPERVFPIPTIEANLRKKPEEARSIYLDKILSLPPEEQRVLLTPNLRRVTADVAAESAAFEGDPETNPWTTPTSAQELRKLREHVRTSLAAVQASLSGAEGLVSTLEGTLPEKPDEDRDAYARAMLDMTEAWAVLKLAIEQRTRTQTSLNNGRVNLDRLTPDPGPEPTVAGASTIVNTFAPLVPLQQQLLLGVVQGALCPVCGGFPDIGGLARHMMATSQNSEAIDGLIARQPPPGETPDHVRWRTATQERTKLERVLLGLEAQLETATGQVPQAVIRVQTAQEGLMQVLARVHPPTLGEDPAAVLATLQSDVGSAEVSALAARYREQLAGGERNRARWAAWTDAKAIVDRQRARVPRLQRIVTALDDATKAVLQGSLDTFLARMSRYVLPGWEPLLLLEDERGSEAFRLALRVDGVTCHEPSGVQALSLLYAFALALDERDPCPYMILSPPAECHISAKALPGLVRVLVQVPDHVQVVLHTTGEVGKRASDVDGVLVVDLDRTNSTADL